MYVKRTYVDRVVMLDRQGNETEYYSELSIKQTDIGQWYIVLESNLDRSKEYLTGKLKDLEQYKQWHEENIAEMKSYN